MNNKRENYIQKTIEKLKSVKENKKRNLKQHNTSPYEFQNKIDKIFEETDPNSIINTLTSLYSFDRYDEDIIKSLLSRITQAEDEYLRIIEDKTDFQIFSGQFSKNFLEELAKMKSDIPRIDLLNILNYFLILIDRETMVEKTARARLRELFKKVSPMGWYA